MEYSTREEDEIGHVDLYFIFMNAEDVLLNHPTLILILKLGLVEVLKVMVEKAEQSGFGVRLVYLYRLRLYQYKYTPVGSEGTFCASDCD